MAEEPTLWVVAEASDPDAVSGERRSKDTGGQFRSRAAETLRSLVRQRVPVDAVALKAQMNGLLKVVGDLFEQAEQQTGMQLQEVELSVEINAAGQVSLVGTGGSIGNKGGITLKFTPRQPGQR